MRHDFSYDIPFQGFEIECDITCETVESDDRRPYWEFADLEITDRRVEDEDAIFIGNAENMALKSLHDHLVEYAKTEIDFSQILGDAS